MKTVHILLSLTMATLLAGCAKDKTSSDVQSGISASVLGSAVQTYSPRNTGQQMAQYITSNYKKVVDDCGSSRRPAFLCSGVMLRATNPDTSYRSWDPSPASVTSGGVSFSYLRADSKFDNLAYNHLNGFMIYPHSYAPDGKNNDLAILCMFPIDAATNSRTQAGCGAHASYSEQSGPCQEQGITTAEQWYNHYISTTGNKHAHQCGFDTKESSQPNSAPPFINAIKAMKLIAAESFKEQNELRIATWSTTAAGYPSNFPIEAFFYVYQQNRAGFSRAAVEKGLTGARHDQQDYFNLTGIAVPIIRLSLPLTSAQDATFTYAEADQAINIP
ncbi:HvnC protein [Enterobacter roggenkampii]|uniref:HvnC protein n=1 Tax=Enterobacter roggenkampii TaxID=1812935 RepID=UPI002FF784BE